MTGHSFGMRTSGLLRAAREPARASDGAAASAPASIAEVYDAHFDFVWRTARRLGVPATQLDDVVQEVFVVVHRRLREFEGRSELTTWLFGITRRVVRNHRRARVRRPALPLGNLELADPTSRDGESALAARQQAHLLHQLLDELDDDKRELFVLAELEEMSGPAIAEALELSLSNVYARLRAARQAFERALRRHRARRGER